MASVEPEQVLRQTLELVSQEVQAERAQVFLRDRENPRLFRVAYSIGMNESQAAQLVIEPGEQNLVSRCITQNETYLLHDIENDAKLVPYIRNRKISTVMCTPIYDREKGEVRGVLNIESLKKESYSSEDRALFNLMRLVMENSLQAAYRYERQKSRAEQESTKKEEIKKLFSRFVPPAFVEKIVENPSNVKLGGEKKPVTVLVADIRSFSTYSEKLPPEIVVSVLNEFFTRAYRTIISHGGTVDKFIGDAVMVLFGAPLTFPDDAFRAVLTAVSMMEEAKEFARTSDLLKNAGWDFSIGIGVNSAYVISGNIGAEECLNYTVVGDGVNLAFRLEEIAKPGQILITRKVYDEVKERVIVEKLSPVHIKGRKEPVEVFNVTGIVWYGKDVSRLDFS